MHIDVIHLIGLAVNPVTLYWTLSALYGVLLTARNLHHAWQARRLLIAARVRPALLVTAFTPVRTHALTLLLHAVFLALGIYGILTPTPSDFSTNPFTAVITLLFLATPLILIVLSATIHGDMERADRLETTWRTSHPTPLS